jgi:hypothetical protein
LCNSISSRLTLKYGHKFVFIDLIVAVNIVCLHGFLSLYDGLLLLTARLWAMVTVSESDELCVEIDIN